MLISVGTTHGAALGSERDQVVGQPGAVLDRVEPGGDEPGQRVLTEHVRGDAGAEFVRAADRLGQHVVRPDRREIAELAVDPVGGDLDPAVAVRPPGVRPRRPARPVRPRCRARGCSAWDGRCAGRRGSAAAGRRATAPSGCRPASPRRAAAARRRRGPCAPAAPAPRGSGSCPRRRQPDVAVRVDEARQHPAAARDRVGVAARPVEGQAAVDEPRVALGLVRQEHTTHVQRHALQT